MNNSEHLVQIHSDNEVPRTVLLKLKVGKKLKPNMTEIKLIKH